MPQIDDLLDCLGGSRYFTSQDLASGYWQILINPADHSKIAFCTNKGPYEFLVMPFGLFDAPSTFQRLMNFIFDNLIASGILAVYLDDLLIHTVTWQEHLQVVAKVLRRLQQFNLKLQLRKCKWGSTKLKFLGFTISHEGLTLDPAKVLDIDNFPVPYDVKQLQSFLGLLNIFVRFVSILASITAPLYNLVQKKFVDFTTSTSF